MTKKCAVLFSGGKDSCLALHKARQAGLKIDYLLSIMPENPDSFMFHKPYLELLTKQAEELDIELVIKGSKGEKEKELMDLRNLIESVKDKIDVIVVGGIASSYQGNRISKICDELNLEFFAPLWDYSPEEVWDELLKEKFKVILTKIACEGLPKEMLGKIIDKENLKKLKKLADKYKFRIDFEGGEAESFVVYMPGFKKEIKLEFDILSQGKYNSIIKIKLKKLK